MRIKHGYDRASNRLYRENDVANTNSVDADEFYTYDDAYRIGTKKGSELFSGGPLD